MTDYTDLLAKAKAAKEVSRNDERHGWHQPVKEFRAAASPDTIIALLEELEEKTAAYEIAQGAGEGLAKIAKRLERELAEAKRDIEAISNNNAALCRELAEAKALAAQRKRHFLEALDDNKLELEALDIQRKAHNAAIEEAAKVADGYSQVSPLHNYGPQGLSAEEKIVMRTGTFIAQDIRALARNKEPTNG